MCEMHSLFDNFEILLLLWFHVIHWTKQTDAEARPLAIALALE